MTAKFRPCLRTTICCHKQGIFQIRLYNKIAYLHSQSFYLMYVYGMCKLTYDIGCNVQWF
jgi:hypothetical protein